MLKALLLNPLKILFLIIVIFYGNISFAETMLSSLHKNKFIAYTIVGDGQPLVLIHAFPTDQRLWQPQQQGLQNDFHVITLDLWGFGHSSPLDGNVITLDQYAEEVKELLDKLHIQQAIIGGESMGGRVALSFLKHYPERVRGLILSNTESRADTKDEKLKRETTAQIMQTQGTASFNQFFMQKALTQAAPHAMRLSLQGMLKEQSKNAMASAWRGIALRDETSTTLSKTKVPVLIITSDRDTLISPKQSEAMHALAKNSQLVILSGAAHLSSLEQAKKWNEAVINKFSTVR